jgi:hypothetical protein
MAGLKSLFLLLDSRLLSGARARARTASDAYSSGDSGSPYHTRVSAGEASTPDFGPHWKSGRCGTLSVPSYYFEFYVLHAMQNFKKEVPPAWTEGTANIK